MSRCTRCWRRCSPSGSWAARSAPWVAKPTEDDLVVPFAELGEHFCKYLDDQTMLRRFHVDLETLGLRPRRQHDARRTFISLCLSDGGRKEILKWVTHSRPKADQMDDYTTLLWNPLCEEVAKLKIRLRTGESQQRQAAVANGSADSPDGSGDHRLSDGELGAQDTPRATPSKGASEISLDSKVLTAVQESARRGTRTPMAVNR
jgi:hypothetical protein